MICNKCDGKKKVECTVSESGVESKIMLPCFKCKATGEIHPDQLITQQQQDSAWCKCKKTGEDAPDVNFHDDGNSQVYNDVISCSKHHYSCCKCGLITQIG